MFMISNEEIEAIQKVKEAIEILKKLQKKPPYIIWVDGTPYNKTNQIQIILNVIDNQQKEIEEKTTIIMAGAEKVKQLEKEIQRLEKDNDTLSKLVIVNEDKVIKELDLISKDKIRQKIKKAKEIKWQIPKLVIEYFEELLEEE